MISILIPVLNGVKHIRECIEGIQNQTYKDYVVNVWDGCSQNGTMEYLLDLKNKWEKIKIISGPDDGPADAINKAFKYSQGDIVTIPLADTYYQHENVFSEVIKIFNQDLDLSLIYGDMRILEEESGKYIRDYPSNISKVWEYPSLHFSTLFLRRKLFSDYRMNIQFYYLNDYFLMLSIYLYK